MMLSPWDVMPFVKQVARLRLVIAGALLGLACAHTNTLPGTSVTDTPDNRNIIETIEQYRNRLSEKNVDGLILLASEKYFEDSGTPQADDDYGYRELRGRLARTLARVQSFRYEIKYRNIRREGSRAEVEVYLSGAFELAADPSPRYRRVSDYHRFVLELAQNGKWKFLAGM